MIHAETLLAVVGLIYLIECGIWISRSTIGFWRPWPGRWRVTYPGAVFGNAQSGLVSVTVWPPLGPTVLCPGPACSLSPRGVFGYVAQAINGLERPRQVEHYFDWDQVQQVEYDGKRVFVSGHLLCEAATPSEAANLARNLARLARIDPSAREAQILADLDGLFHRSAAEARWDEFARRTRGLAVLANLLFGLIFGGTWLLISWGPARANWPVLALAFVFVQALVVQSYAKVRRELYPGADPSPVAHWAWMACSPLAGLRAVDVLGRYVLAEFHPLVAGSVLLQGEDFAELARRTLIDLEFPLEPNCHDAPPKAQETERWYRGQTMARCGQLAGQLGWSLGQLLAPPLPEGPESQAYCPRCRGQFVSGEGACQSCGGMAVVAFGPLADANPPR